MVDWLQGVLLKETSEAALKDQLNELGIKDERVEAIERAYERYAVFDDAEEMPEQAAALFFPPP